MIEMIAGVFGLPIIGENGKTIRIKGMGPSDGPFSVSPEREAELVKKGIARYVEDGGNEPYTPDDAPTGFDEMPPEDLEGEGEAVEEPVDLSALSAKELREIGMEYGLTFKGNASKDSMIDAITAAQIALAASEDAPSFDATEAVE